MGTSKNIELCRGAVLPIVDCCHNGDVILTYNKVFWQEYAVKDLCLWAAGYF